MICKVYANLPKLLAKISSANNFALTLSGSGLITFTTA